MKNRPVGFLAVDKIDPDGDIFHYIQELHEYLWRFVRVAFPGTSGNLGDLADNAIELLESAPGTTIIVTIRDGVLQHVIANKHDIKVIPVTNGIPELTEIAEYDPGYAQQLVAGRVLIVTYPVKQVSTWVLHGRSISAAISDFACSLAVAQGHVTDHHHITVELEGDHFAAYLVQDR